MFGTLLKNNFTAVCVFCAVVLVDAVSKKIITTYFVGRALLGGFLTFGNFANTKGLFGLTSLALAVVISVVVFAFIFYLLFRTTATQEKISMSLVLGGGISNFSERLIFGRVTDILAVGNFGVMNIADVAIFVGMIWYALLLVKKHN